MTGLNLRHKYSEQAIVDGSIEEDFTLVAAEPWPQRVSITWYDIGSQPIKIGQEVTYDCENGRATYRVVVDPDGLGCDFDCELQPGSTWRNPE